ncbi:alpha/beta fold family hydrolase [Salinisphaera sp. T5B8]|uniref:alpha/beta hydrolase n=1 Tax=Salinisphaera sp. T5B8 TaxID=1304154 RepID=UPI00334022A4
MNRSLIVFVAVLAIGTILIVSILWPTVARAQSIEWDACPRLVATLSAAQTDCGWLDTGEPLQGQPVRLRFAILRARPDRKDAYPVVYVPGGPGESAGVDAPALTRWQRWQQQAGWPHDIVLFDPRGTGESQPRPRCAPDTSLPWRAPASARADNAFAREAIITRQCLARLGKSGMQALGPAAQLRDIAALLTGLGVTRASLWGVSYGTRIARLFARRYPAQVDTLVLDSIVPFDQNELAALPLQIDSAITQLDRTCRAAGACPMANPRAAVGALLKRFDAQPAVVALVGYDNLPLLFEITPYRLLLMLLFAAYDSDQTADTRIRLERALRGQTAALMPLAARVAAQASSRGHSTPVFWATRCALYVDGPEAARAWQKALSQAPMIAPYIEQAPQASVCEDWPLPRYQADPRALPDRPILVVAGTDDVLTPARASQAFARARPSARWAPIAGAGHAPTLSQPQAQGVVAEFLRERSRQD